MTLIGMLHHRKDPNTVIKSYAYAVVAMAEGADFIYFTPKSVNFDNQTIEGYEYKNGSWQEKITLFPDVIYNTGSPEKLDVSKDIINQLKETIPFTTVSLGNKWVINERLIKGKEFSNYLIPAKVLKEWTDLTKFLNLYTDVVVKPMDGRKGQGIYFIKTCDKGFIVNKDSQDKTYTKNELKEFFYTLLEENTYIVQPYIISKTKSGLAFDFRLHAQKNGEGKWVITTIYPRIASDCTIVTNINNGGYTNYLLPFLNQEFSEEEAFNIKRTLEYFTLALARHLDELQMLEFSEVIDEIGIDVGLDENQKLWIYEVNWRPGCPPAFYLELDVVRNTIQYAIYLANNHDKVKRDIRQFKKRDMEKRKVPIIAVTGSAGKTTTKSFISSILQTRWNTFESKDYWNRTDHTQIHADLINNNHQAVVLEYGMGFPGVITEHCRIIQPNISVITNVGMAHIGNFDGDIKKIAKAKSELIHGTKQNGILFINKDCENSKLLEIDQFKGKIITTGIKNPADYRAYNVSYAENGMKFKVRLHDKEWSFFIPIYGEHHVYNALNAIAVADYLGFTPPEIKSGLLFRKPPRRLTIYHLKHSITLIDDSVHSTPQGVVAAIDVLKNISPNRKIAVLGRMIGLGDRRVEQYQKIGRYLVKQGIDMVITYGRYAKGIGYEAIDAGLPPENFKHFMDEEAMHEYLLNILQENDTILVKGASIMNMFNTVQFLNSVIGVKE
ncbi:UDP-N-acetylmuramoyl-tripeptide--D-alanyl-D-alanine ligase [Neobacillus niacini]|uniref:YheC/YheD family protein n=1 Tax=Neobacillus driksii TaxID=3035913 RepID=UPI0027829B01|nr:YheC/YheD family protein [Neobacillus niacini]MDQ0973058.1 UDP-N-acetylmuramoyl-tripeptide--D-alanyl-D-alanine ligase [Neobacillus niacini]